VDSVTLDQALALVREVAQRKARAFARRWRFTYDEGEDVESDLVLAFIYRWPKFDPARASIQTFASRLMDKELISIVRYRLAQRRQAREFPTGAGRTMGAPIHQFRIDLERALAPLPTVVRQTAAALSCLSAVDAASAARCSRQTINNRKRQIGKALLAGGISPTYFHGGG
jgi:hypothetical protein